VTARHARCCKECPKESLMAADKSKPGRPDRDRIDVNEASPEARSPGIGLADY